MKSMLKWLSVLLLAAAAAAQSPPASKPAQADASANWLPAPAAGEDPTIQKARKLLTQMIEEMGGNAYMTVQTMDQVGTSYPFYQGRPSGLGTEFHRIVKFPDKERTELTKQRDVVYIVNGDKGYEVTYKGTTLQDPKTWEDYVRRRNYSMEWLLRIWLKQPGTQIYYDGTALAEQRLADVVTLLNAKNESASFYIDQNTHLPIKKTFTFRDPIDKQKDEEGEVYGNWRPEGGINTPHSVVRTHNGDYTNQRFIKTVTYNVAAPDSLFDAKQTYDPYVLERRLYQEQHPQK